ncbi:MAG TPA: hypothetical protein VMV29_03625, partial [Ktedonobacterales bacterium]|nr:hypothetical protein [Ktedonobacterales bacterium]
MPKTEGSPQVFFRSGPLYPQLAERAHVPTAATPGSTRRTLRLDRTLGNPSSSVGSTLGLTAHRDLT